MTVMLALIGGVAAAVTTTATLGDDLSGLPAEDVIRMHRLRGGLRSFSPDGKWLAYTAGASEITSPGGDATGVFARSGLAAEGIGSDIAIVSLRTRETRNLTEGKGGSWLPSWSPNSRYLAFVSTRDGSGQAALWVWDAEEDRLKKISDAAIRMRGPQQIGWTPDSQKLLVTTVTASLSVAEYTKRVELGEEKQTVGAVDSTAILYEATAVARDRQGAIKSDPWGLDDTLSDLVLVNLADGASTTIVHKKRIACFHLFGDGSQVAYSTLEQFEEAGSQQVLFNIAVATLAGGKERVVASGLRLELVGEFSLSPDGSQLSYRAYGPAHSNFDVYVVGMGDQKARNLTKFPGQGPLSPKSNWAYSLTPLWDVESKNVYYISRGDLWQASLREGTTREVAHVDGRQIRDLVASAESLLWTTRGGRSTVVITHNDSEKEDGFYEIELRSGIATKLLETGQCYTCEPGVRGRLAAVTDDGRWFAYTAEDAQHAADIWLGDAGFQNLWRLTRLNPGFDKHKMGAARLIDWLDDDGERRHGALILPSDYQEGKRSPLIVLVYGGAVSSEKIGMFGGFDRSLPYLNVQLFATRGYAVLMPDAPQHLASPMLDLAKTVLPGVNKVVEMGVADPERLGVMGHSYGGYSVLSLIVQTNRFKVAVECDGYGDLVGQYGEMAADGTAFGSSIGETGQGLMGGTPWQYRARYVENSPIFYLDRVETPLLIVHGAEDPVVAPFLGDEVFVGLRRLGKAVQYAKYKHEGHIVTGYANQLDVANRVSAWLERYLKP